MCHWNFVQLVRHYRIRCASCFPLLPNREHASDLRNLRGFSVGCRLVQMWAAARMVQGALS